MTRDEKYMMLAIEQAKEALLLHEVAVGAIIVKDDIIISSAYNRKEIDKDPMGHAEIIAIRKATLILNDWRLSGCEMFSTLEPCAMCAGAIIGSRLKRLVFGAFDIFEGFFGSKDDLSLIYPMTPRIEVLGGVLLTDCKQILLASFDNLMS